MEMYQNILTSIADKILTITISRESKLNALNRQTLSDLHQALTDSLSNPNVSGIIITGSGDKAFIAGADIAELKELNAEEGYNLASEGQLRVFDVIAQSGKPVIAAINGFALGGGLELALACHIRVASENARLGLPEVSLGLIPGYGGTQRLTALIGRGRALEMILTGDMISANEALVFGLVNHVVPQAQALQKSREILFHINERSATAVAAAIRSINAAGTDYGFKKEIEEFSNCFGNNHFKEGTAAFLEKRKPNFN